MTQANDSTSTQQQALEGAEAGTGAGTSNGPSGPEESGSPALQQILADLTQLMNKALSELENAGTLAALEELKIAYLGKKGELSRINRQFGTLGNDEKPLAGKSLNEAKTALTERENARREALELQQIEARLQSERLDVTLPASPTFQGHLHPITQTKRQIEAIFRSMGFRVTDSPEIEAPWVNFDALNFMPDHPARDMQDTFFTERGHVLRTHTSGNQIRTLMNAEPPLAIISSGKVYRCDSDSTHSPMFHQMEGFLVAENISMAHLKGTLQEFLVNLFGTDTKVRFRPSFFPFTEPSAEVDIECNFTGQGWMEVLGCGMIHPNVLRNCKIDPEKYSGFAFGLGLDRLAMLKFGINNIRLMYENDQRFLAQF